MCFANQDAIRNGRKDSFAEIAVSVVHIEISHRENNPIRIFLLMGQVVADQIIDIGSDFLANQGYYFLLHFCRQSDVVIPQRAKYQCIRQDIVKAQSPSSNRK